MKKTLSLISFFLLLFTNKVSSQDYLPFPQDSAIWYYVDYDYNPMPPPLATFNTYIYEADGDTLINGTIYTKLYNAYENYPSTYEGAYRVDDINSRVYFIDSFYNTEGLLYDFSLVPGDTIPVINGTDTAFHVVCMDTASIVINNLPHLALSIFSYDDYGNTCHTVWVKGIGSMKHPLETELFCAEDWFETSYFLNCYFYKDEKIFQEPNNPFFEGCYGQWIGIDDLSTEKFFLFPNPVTDIAQITSTTRANELFDYQVLDILGKIENECYNIRLNEIRIDPRTLKNGIHILKLHSLSDNSVIILKFLSNYK
jgi:hypothetical protein